MDKKNDLRTSEEWIVLDTGSDGQTRLVSKGKLNMIIPVGTFLTVEGKDKVKKFVLRVDKSIQEEKFKPSVLLVESDIELPHYEQNCKNIIIAQRVGETNLQSDDSSSFIEPGLPARRSTQDEISEALNFPKIGAPLFLATNLFGRASLLKGLNGSLIYAKIPEDVFYHQMIVAGKTGSGKTNALKYLAQYFIEELHGAVIAVNVKGKDLLTMNRPSVADENIKKEWQFILKDLDYSNKVYKSSGKLEHGISNCLIYVPYKRDPPDLRGVDERLVHNITLSVNDIEPQALSGLMRNLTEIAESLLPDIFRYWFEERKRPDDKFRNFVSYFNEELSEPKPVFTGRTVVGDVIEHRSLSRSTLNNISRELNLISQYFDASGPNTTTLNATDLIQKELLSVIHLTDDITFGSVLLRDIVKKISCHTVSNSSTPVLFIIDETHLFYGKESTEDALGDLSRICRTGRQYRTAIIFASQNPKDIPSDLASVVASKIFFQSEKREASSTLTI